MNSVNEGMRGKIRGKRKEGMKVYPERVTLPEIDSIPSSANISPGRKNSGKSKTKLVEKKVIYTTGKITSTNIPKNEIRYRCVHHNRQPPQG